MYSGSSTKASLIPLAVPVSFVIHNEGSLGDQQWFSSAGHVQGIGSGRDKEFGTPQPYLKCIKATNERSTPPQIQCLKLSHINI
ncbi:hypothetical protein MTR67_051328 [Solanum verrucosum]|uniref:Uncharacterized protein n=1 Tax=Solanum verrucosum TaxID=315347 RepID=A0AAF0V745_SOLVR|nr:hypothetical protein MTR67_051328 [Solanum verrucosum]